MKTKIVTDYCRKCGDEKRMCGQKASPDEFRFSLYSSGLFAFIWFDLFPQFKMILYSKMRAEFINIHTNENEDKNG